MRRLASLAVPGAPQKRIDLLQGDLASPSANDAFDLLIVSAFPGNYEPTTSSLIGALDGKGLSVAELAADKEIDLREHFCCWMSRELPPRFGFRRILCFEPLVRGDPPSVVGDIFRSLAPILGDRIEIRSVAMPIVATGNQRRGIREMLAPLLDAALHWMRHGLPLDRLMIVVRSDGDEKHALDEFATRSEPSNTPTPRDRPPDDYDLFISYARENQSEVDSFATLAERRRPGLRIFVDHKSLKPGTAWQPEIFETLDCCRKVVAFLSPDYLNSKVCIEEFNIAWARGRETGQNLIFPVYLYSANLPTYMCYRSYVDCREGDIGRLRQACASLLGEL